MVQSTQGMAVLFFLLVIGLVGGLYLFTMNHMAFHGYVLQKQIEQQKDLNTELSILETKIAKIETQEFLVKNKFIKDFPAYEKPQFFVQKDSFTAQKESISAFNSEL